MKSQKIVNGHVESIEINKTIDREYSDILEYVNTLNLRHDITVILEIIDTFIKVKILENGSFRSQFYSFEPDFNDVLKLELNGLIDSSPKIELIKLENGIYKADIYNYQVNILKIDKTWILVINDIDYPSSFKTKKDAFNHALYILEYGNGIYYL